MDFIQTQGIAATATKGTHLFRQGDEEQDKNLYYVSKGLVKAYYLSSEGQETIKSFISEGNVIASLLSIYNGEPCSFSLYCLEDCKLIKIPSAKLIALAKSDKEMAHEMQHLLLQLAMKKERREYELLCLTAEERYQRFRSQSAELLTRITQNDIARYLGVTPVGLSRIKNRQPISEAAVNSLRKTPFN
jgi:CRP-like cAMP-binding protein